MSHHSGGLSSSTCVLLSITLILSQSILADTDSTNSDSTKSVSKSHTSQEDKPQQLSLDKNVEFKKKSTFAADEAEPQSELQKLLSHEQDSHIHLGGKIMLKDDASIVHPSLQSIEGGEIDLTIDFE